MGSIPLPALHVNPPQQGPSPFEQLAQLRQIQNYPLQQQAMQQQVQAGALDVQAKQMDIAARQAFQAASANSITKDANGTPTFDADKFQQGIAGTPAFTPETIESLTKMQKARVDLQSSITDLQTKQQDVLGNAAAAIKASNYNPTVAHAILDQFPPSPQTQQIRASIDNPNTLKQWTDTAIAQSAKQRELGAQETQANARMTTATTEQQKVQASMNPQSSLYAPSPAAIAMGTAPGAAQIKANEVQQAARKAGAEEAARLPGEMTLNAQRQALAQGDPKMAGHLMVTGDATLGELKSRGATPQFIAQALQAAHDESGGKYNAQAAEAQFDVAKSPANNNFFGSAKSLTDKGGTLDQLADAAKAIPGGKIPAFNSIADWEKAATGSGPIAKYATLALSVADDWSKVMGSGSGSDASRAQALQRVGANLSPEQRAASIEGLRGGVNSQITSRIGKNPVLQRMYGDMVQNGATASNAVASSGKQVSLAAARSLPINKGKTDDQIRADIESHGHTVAP